MDRFYLFYVYIYIYIYTVTQYIPTHQLQQLYTVFLYTVYNSPRWSAVTQALIHPHWQQGQQASRWQVPGAPAGRRRYPGGDFIWCGSNNAIVDGLHYMMVYELMALFYPHHSTSMVNNYLERYLYGLRWFKPSFWFTFVNGLYYLQRWRWLGDVVYLSFTHI